MQTIFTTLWTIWNDRTQAVRVVSHQLMFYSHPKLSCCLAGTKKLKLKLKSTLSARVSKPRWDEGGGNYQELAAIIKIDGKRNKKFRRSGHAYEAKNNEGTGMFV